MWKSLRELVKLLIAVSVIFAATSFGILCLRVSSAATKVATSTTQTLTSVQSSVATIQKDVDNIQVMANTTLFQAEEVLHHTDVYIATAQSAQKHQLQQLDELIAKTSSTVEGLNESQRAVSDNLNATLQQTTKTVQDLQPLVGQLTNTTKSLQETVELTQPILKNSNEILSHVNGISADAQTEVHNLVYPQPKPWYAKVWGVTKLALRMLTIPLK